LGRSCHVRLCCSLGRLSGPTRLLASMHAPAYSCVHTQAGRVPRKR
jgi:hypothetical protein